MSHSQRSPVHIVGGGLIGLLTAYELSDAGETVVILERDRLGAGSSWAGGGILSPLYPWRYPDTVNRLARWSQQHYQALVDHLRDETGIDAEWRETGMLVMNADDGEEVLRWSQRSGGRWERITAKAARELEPGLDPALTHDALFDASLAQVRNPRLIKALRAALLARGVVLREGIAVQGVITRGGKLAALRTRDEEWGTERCVVTAGAWTGDLMRATGLSLPVHPVRGQMLLIKAEPGTLAHMVMRDSRYLIPRSDGRILVGSTLEEAGFEAKTTVAARQDLWESALSLVPRLGDYPIESQWAGLRPGSPDGVPFIGTHPGIEGLYISAGHYRNGIVLGPASARLAADLLLGRPPILDPQPYGLETYAKIG